MSHATNTANTYNQAVKNEQQHLDNYLSYLNGVQDKINGGSTNKPGGGSKEDATYAVYKVGEKVQLKNNVEHKFYVIEDGGETQEFVTVLTMECINTSTLEQKNPNTVAFSTTVYWSAQQDIDETLPIDDTHIAAKAAYDYGTKIQGINGRLMKYSEAYSLLTSHEFIFSDSSNFWWLGTASDEMPKVRFAHTSIGLPADSYDRGDVFCVRPLLEISKDLVELAQ